MKKYKTNLVVDLDQSLLKIDLFKEVLVISLISNPRVFFKTIILAIYNKAKAKTFIAKNTKLNNQILTIPFETFVIKPQPYLEKLEKFFGTEMSHKTKRILKQQKIPRKKVSDSLNFAAYKHAGWEPPETTFTERQELDKRRDYALSQGASKDAMDALDAISQSYEEKIWNP